MLSEKVKTKNDLVEELSKPFNEISDFVIDNLREVRNEIKALGEGEELLRDRVLDEYVKNFNKESKASFSSSNGSKASVTKTFRHSIFDMKQAVSILKFHHLDKYISKAATVELKPGVNPDDIPKELLKQFLEYFNLKIETNADAKDFASLFDSGVISEAEFKSCINSKEILTVRVS